MRESVRMARVVTVAASVALLACKGEHEPGSASPATSVDTLTSGRVVVRNPDVPADSGRWRLRERLRLGSIDREGPELFARIGGLELGSDGEVYVLDAQTAEIRVFDRHADFQRAFGRRGEGPGELLNPGGITRDAQGLLWVLNWGNARYTAFDPSSGEVVREVRRPLAYASLPWGGAFDEGRHLIDVGLDRTGGRAAIRLDTAFVPTDTIALPELDERHLIVFRNEGRRVASVPDPFAPRPSWAPRPRGGIVIGEAERYRAHRIRFEGDTIMTIEVERAPVPVSTAERDSALRAIRDLGDALGAARPDRDPRVREVKPFHEAIFVDDQDRTWVRTLVARGARPTWDVIGADGHLLGRVSIPVSTTYVRPILRNGRLAIATQDDGIPTVVVYHLVTAGDGT